MPMLRSASSNYMRVAGKLGISEWVSAREILAVIMNGAVFC